MKSLLKYSFLLLMLSACFSNKGLPIKSNDDSLIKTEESQNAVYIVDHSDWDALLKKHVRENGDVDYKGFKKDAQALKEYIDYLSNQVPTDDWSVQEQLAYFINVYNANVIELIVNNYPTESIKDINNPWLKNRIKVGNKDFSLAGIEKGILQKMDEPRIHFAINCASISCPKLLRTAYTAGNVDELTDRAAREFINNSKKNKITKDNPQLSEIFKWYASDFTASGKTLIEYINQYSEITISQNAKIDYIQYNWELNEVK